MTNFIEEELPVIDNRRFLRGLFGPEVELTDGWRAHVAYTYIKNTPRLICGFVSSPQSNISGEVLTLKTMLDKYPPQTFMDLVFLVSVFGREQWRVEKYFNTPFMEPSKSIVDDICRPTRGYILYNYQIEQLIALFTCDQQRIEKLRRNWNKKKASSCQALQRLYVPGEEKSLWQILKERALLGVTDAPNMHGARLLYKMR